MKIKDEITIWRESVKKLTEQSIKVAETTAAFFIEVKELKEQIITLSKLTEEMTETMLSLLRIQAGD